MLARRNLRRNLAVVFCLPIIALGLFTIHHNRDAVLSRYTSFYSEDNDHVRMKRSTSLGNPSAFHIVDQEPEMNMRMLETQPAPLVDRYRQARQYQDVNPVYSVIDTKNLERFVHLDLKGAAPKIEYYQKLFPFLKQLGATGLLVEYEDMFPFTDRLAVIRHGLAYSKSDIEQLLHLARMSGLKVMPLLQVYGHLEYVLKLKEFMHLREDRRYPQVITPCLEESYKLIFGRVARRISLALP